MSGHNKRNRKIIPEVLRKEEELEPEKDGWKIIKHGSPEARFNPLLAVKNQSRFVIVTCEENFLAILIDLMNMLFRKNARVRLKDLDGNTFYKPEFHSVLPRETLTLASLFWEYEDVMINGCFGIALHDLYEKKEVGADEHKIIYCAGQDVNFYDVRQMLMINYELMHKPKMTIVPEVPHIHTHDETPRFKEFVRALCSEF